MENRADDLARQQAAQAAATQQAVEAKTAPTPQEQQRINETFGLEARQQPFLEARARATPEDLFRQLGPVSAQYAQGVQERTGQTPEQLFQNISPEAAQLAQYISQRFGMSPEELFGGISPAAASLQRTVSQEAATPQTIPFQDVFQPEYQLLRQNVLADAARRGFGTGSGLEIEQLGRAGVDLAIRQAGLRQQNAQINQQLRQQALENAAQLAQAQYGLKNEAVGQEGGLVQTQQSLAEQARNQALGLSEAGAGLSAQARNELASYLSNLQNLSEAARGRQTQGVVQSYASAQPAYQRAAAFDTSGLSALNQRVQQSRQDVQGLASGLASTIGAIGGGYFGGPFGGAIGSQLGGSILGGQRGGAADLLGAMRQMNAGAGIPSYGQPGYHGEGYFNNPGLYAQQYPIQRRGLFGGNF